MQCDNPEDFAEEPAAERPPLSPQGTLIQTYANIFTSATLCHKWQQCSPFEGHLNELSAKELWPHWPTAVALFQRAFTQPAGWHQAVRSHHDNDHPGYPKDESVNHICELNMPSYPADFCPYHRIQFTQLNIFDQVWPLESISVIKENRAYREPGSLVTLPTQKYREVKKTLKSTKNNSLGVLTHCLNKSFCKHLCWFS